MTFTSIPPTKPGFYAWKQDADTEEVDLIELKPSDFKIPFGRGLWCPLLPADETAQEFITHHHNPIVAQKNKEIETLKEEVEKAFREGYGEGYETGSSDSAKYDSGGGATSISERQHEREETWNSSRAKKVVEGKEGKPRTARHHAGPVPANPKVRS